MDTIGERGCQVEEPYKAWLASDTPKTAESYWQVNQSMVRGVTEAKTLVMEEFAEGMEHDFQPAQKKFSQILASKKG